MNQEDKARKAFDEILNTASLYADGLDGDMALGVFLQAYLELSKFCFTFDSNLEFYLGIKEHTNAVLEELIKKEKQKAN